MRPVVFSKVSVQQYTVTTPDFSTPVILSCFRDHSASRLAASLTSSDCYFLDGMKGTQRPCGVNELATIINGELFYFIFSGMQTPSVT